MDEYRTHVLSDNSGYYIIATDNSDNKAIICRYLFSSSTSAQWQKVSTIDFSAYGTLLIDDTQLFFFGSEPTPNYHLHYYKITFGEIVCNWTK